jgi:hypothetical protein
VIFFTRAETHKVESTLSIVSGAEANGALGSSGLAIPGAVMFVHLAVVTVRETEIAVVVKRQA